MAGAAPRPRLAANRRQDLLWFRAPPASVGLLGGYNNHCIVKMKLSIVSGKNFVVGFQSHGIDEKLFEF